MKMPPKIKVYEALTAIANNSVGIENNTAVVYSSNKSKFYNLEWDERGYSSNDNATFYQGYPGYPIIAVLLLTNKLSYDNSILKFFENIDWKKINTKFKSDYEKSIEFVFQNFNKNDIEFIEKEVDQIYNSLEALNIVVKRSKRYPPE